jgi:hypothetical protein
MKAPQPAPIPPLAAQKFKKKITKHSKTLNFHPIPLIFRPFPIKKTSPGNISHLKTVKKSRLIA